MKSNNSFPFKILIFMFLTSLVCAEADAQLRRKQIVDEKKALSRRSEKHVVVVNTETIKNLMVKCLELGINDVQFVFAKIRKDDIAEYVINHPEAIGYESELIGKLTVLIKVEGVDLDQNTFVTDPPQPGSQNNSLIRSMNSAGFVRVNKPYGEILTGPTKVLYFEVGSICPPPATCR